MITDKNNKARTENKMGEKYVWIVHPCKIYGILASGKPFILVGPEKSPSIIHQGS